MDVIAHGEQQLLADFLRGPPVLGLDELVQLHVPALGEQLRRRYRHRTTAEGPAFVVSRRGIGLAREGVATAAECAGLDRRVGRQPRAATAAASGRLHETASAPRPAGVGAAAGVEHLDRRAGIGAGPARRRRIIKPLAGVVELARVGRPQSDRQVRRRAKYRPADRGPISGAGHGRERERDGRLTLRLRVPVAVEDRRHPGDRADRGLAQQLVVVAFRILGHGVQRGGDLRRRGDFGIDRGAVSWRLQVGRCPRAMLCAPCLPGDDAVDGRQHLLEPLEMIGLVVVEPRDSVGGRGQGARIRVVRIVRFEGDPGGLVSFLDREQIGCDGPCLEGAAFALVGDGVHHVAHLPKGDVAVCQRDRRLEAHEFAHRVAGPVEIVKKIVLLALGRVGRIP